MYGTRTSNSSATLVSINNLRSGTPVFMNFKPIVFYSIYSVGGAVVEQFPLKAKVHGKASAAWASLNVPCSGSYCCCIGSIGRDWCRCSSIVVIPLEQSMIN